MRIHIIHRHVVAGPGRARPFAGNTAHGLRARAFLTSRPAAVTMAILAPILARRSRVEMPASAVVDCLDVKITERRSAAWSAVASLALVVAIVALSALACIR